MNKLRWLLALALAATCHPANAQSIGETGTPPAPTVSQGGAPWSQNVTQWNSIALGSPSNYGTSPGAVAVPGVNAFVTNTPSVTLPDLEAGLGAGTAPSKMTLGGMVYNATAPAPTNGQTMALQADQAGNLRHFPGTALATLSAWSSGTSVNSTQTIYTNSGAPDVLVQVDTTTTITAGAISFQVTYDGTNWVTVAANQVLDPTSTTLAQISLPYTLVASTNKPFLIKTHGAQGLRIILTTAITGTGTLTPYYALLATNDIPESLSFQAGTWTVQPGNTANTTPWLTTVSPATSGGVSVASGSIGATKTAIKTSAGQIYCWAIDNPNTSIAYVQVFNLASASITLGTTTPTFSLGIPGGGGSNLCTDEGMAMGTAITIAVTTTRTGSAAPASTVDYNIWYQ